MDIKPNTNKSFLIGGAVVLAISWLETLFLWSKIPPKIPWFYSLLWGEDQLMNKGGLIWTLSLASLLFFVTTYLPKWIKKDDLVIERSVFIALGLISVLLFLSLTKVLMIFVS